MRRFLALLCLALVISAPAVTAVATSEVEAPAALASIRPEAPPRVPPGAAPSAAPQFRELPDDDSGAVARLLQKNNILLTLISFFGFGLLLSLTPCVFPMIPILSGIIVGQGRSVSRRRTFLLSAGYVLGMAVAYTLAGMGAALSGTLVSALFQNVWALGGFALLFVVLALSMFGCFELQPPAFVRKILGGMGAGSGSLAGAALMGALSALLVSPCVAAPLAGALLYIARTGNLFVGGSSLFCMALGMGVPLILVGVLSGSVLPKAGQWMELIRKGFGLVLLGVAVWLLKPVAPEGVVGLAWALLLLAGGIGLYHAVRRGHDSLTRGARAMGRCVAVMVMLAGCALLGGGVSGPVDLASLWQREPAASSSPLRFEVIGSLAELERRVAAGGRPVMLYVTADWCGWCKKMHHTLNDRRVRRRLSGFTTLMVDITESTKEEKRLLRKFGVYGPPGILFIGFEDNGMRVKRSVAGYRSVGKFLEIVAEAAAPRPVTVNRHEEGSL